MAKIGGGCLCGALTYEVEPPSKWCAHCHCSMCRRAHGAAYVTWFGVARERFTLLSSDTLERHPSSETATRGFCRRCGSMMLFESSRWADEVHITLASLHGALDREPQAHVFFDDRAPWVTIGDRLPRRGGPTGTKPIEPDVAAAIAAYDSRVRLAGPEDAEAVDRLHRELAALEWEGVPDDMAANIARFLREHHESFVLVIEDQGHLAGVAVVHPFPALAEGGTQLVLDDIHVEERARRRGLGSALFGATLVIARALGAAMLHLSTRPDNEPARRLCEKHGLRLQGDVLYLWDPER